MLRGPWSRARRRSVHRLGLPVVAALAIPGAAFAQPVPPVRVNVSTAGTEANATATLLAVSADGRTVLFGSTASNLVDGDTNGVYDLFIRDRDTDRDGVLDEPGAVRTIRVSQGPAGEQPGVMSGPSGTTGSVTHLSRDGRFILFSTWTAFVAADTNAGPAGEGIDSYLYDRDTDADGIFDEAGAAGLTLVTTGTGNSITSIGPSFAREISTDGRYVLFTSNAPNLPAGPVTNAQFYRKDRVTSVTTLVSSTPDGRPADRPVEATMSLDGRLVALAGGFAGLMPNGLPGEGSFPWVVRDLDANSFVPIAYPTTPASGLPVTSPLVANSALVHGFSADGSRVYLGQQLLLCCLVSSLTGTTLEYDVAAGRVTRRLPGFPPNSIIDRRDPDSFTLIASLGNAAFLSSFTVTDVSRFDLSTNRFVSVVPHHLLTGFDSAGGRTLYRKVQGGAPLVLLDERYGVPLPMPAPVQTGTLDATGSMVIFASADATILPGGADTNGVADIFAVDLLSRLDRDGDGLDDRWEIAMGLDYTSGAGVNGAAGDPDGDGQTNLQEQTAGSHPMGAARSFLAEGADNAFFKTRIALANPGVTPTTAVVRFDGDDGTSRSVNLHVPAGARRTLFVDEVGGTTPSFSTVVDAPLPLVAERTMSWDRTEYGAHAERASPAPATQWFLAEGATGAFSLFYLLQNPGDTATTATIRYLRPAPLPPITRTYDLPAHSRTTLPVDQQAPELASTDVSAAITSTNPILVERAMYRSTPAQPFAAGHASAGVTAAATSWFLAEGATGPFFDLFVLLANPNPTDATVEIRYLLAGGTVHAKTYTVPAESRRTIYVDAEDIPGQGPVLGAVDVSCAITSTNAVPIVVERSMWFPGPALTPNFWTEAHNSPGATATSRRWVLADGETGGSRGTSTYVLIANTSSTAGRARLTVLPDVPITPEDPPGAAPPTTITVDLPANSRTTVPMGLSGQRFGVLVESIDTAPLADLVVERAMYWNAGAEIWAAGTNLLATPVP